MSVNVADINKLRKETGAGMMDCKKALIAAEGDFDEAIVFLRKKGQKVSAKRADKEANEGAVLACTSDDHKKGVLINLNCETDFVAKNEAFTTVADQIADIALNEYPDNKANLLSLPYGDSLSVEEKINELMGKIGEKMQLSNYERMEGETVTAYVHAGNKIGVLAAFNQSGEKIQLLGRDIAMQIAAMKPIAIDKDDVAQQDIDRELDIAREQAKEAGKPDQIIDKIAQGKLNKFYNEQTLLNQAFVKDTSQTIRQVLEATDKDLKVTDFKRIALG